jgi:hypothetical protein
LTRKAEFDKPLFVKVVSTQPEAHMYRIVKRIVHTVTTVTWLVRLEDIPGNVVEKEITFPASHSVTEEELKDPKKKSKITHSPFKPTLDEGDKDE